jgi:hypothetical protein
MDGRWVAWGLLVVTGVLLLACALCDDKPRSAPTTAERKEPPSAGKTQSKPDAGRSAVTN